MDEAPAQDRIEQLVEEEERLWRAAGEGGISEGDRRRLARIRDELDSCWDALRRRRAGSPAAADAPDPANDLEGPDPEPPHLERGSPHEDRPAPDPGEPRDIP